MSRYSGRIIRYNKYSCFVLVEWEEDGFPEASDHVDSDDRDNSDTEVKSHEKEYFDKMLNDGTA